MPAFIGGIVIYQIAGTGNAVFGDAPLITPKSVSKTFSGAGGGNTGVYSFTSSFWSSTNTLDPDLFDENQVSPGPGVYAPVIPGAIPVPAPVPSRVRPVAAPRSLTGENLLAVPAANDALRGRNYASTKLADRKRMSQRRKNRKIKRD